MGACVSTPDRCVGGRLRSKNKRKKSRKRLNSSPARKAPVSDVSPGKYGRSAAPDRSTTTNSRTFQESTEEAWFDPVAILESDCDEDYPSVHGDQDRTDLEQLTEDVLDLTLEGQSHTN